MNAEYIAAIKLVREKLERFENRLLEIRLEMAQHDFEERSFERDQYHYVLGEVCMLRELLMCFGVSPLDLKTAVTVKLQRLEGR
jgi:hypothetical protein